MSWGIGDRVGVAVGIGSIPSFLARSKQSRMPQPSLVLDFAGTGTLDSRITFVRSTTATFTNNSGVLTSAAANVARFDYNPVTLEPLGLLIEEQRTNILLNSLLNGTNLSTQTVITSAVPYTLSFYGTGTIVLAGTNISTQVGTGVYPSRKTFTFTPTAGNLTLTVTGTVQYAQLEAGSFASSFIPTAGAQVTRAADNASMTGTNFSSWFNQGQGTFYGEMSLVYITALQALCGVNLNDGVAVGNVMLLRSNGNNSISFGGYNTSATINSGVSLSANTFFKLAGAYNVSTLAQTAECNGLTPISNNTLDYIGNGNRLQIGGYSSSGNPIKAGRIKKIAYYPTQLTDSQLITLTTL